MWTFHQKAQFVLWYAELKLVVAVQRKWQSLHRGEKPPADKALNRWMNQFNSKKYHSQCSSQSLVAPCWQDSAEAGNQTWSRQKVSNLPLSCLTPLMKTKPSYGAFVFGTREHFMWMGVLINTSAIFGEHGSRMRFTSVFEVHHKWTSGVGFCMIVLLVPSSLVRAPLLGLSISIYLNSTCFHRLKPSNKKL